LGFSTINGNAKCGNGILNNEMYIGRIGRDGGFITTARRATVRSAIKLLHRDDAASPPR
jgi:hypothetical protein